LKSCCRKEINRLTTEIANYNPQHTSDTLGQDKLRRKRQKILDRRVCTYHGSSGQRRKKREEREHERKHEREHREWTRKLERDSKRVMSPFVDRKTTTRLFMLGKQYPWLAAFHRVAYMAFKQVGVPKPVSLMPKKEQARYRKLAKRRESRH
jgi:hypothetical protein